MSSLIERILPALNRSLQSALCGVDSVAGCDVFASRIVELTDANAAVTGTVLKMILKQHIVATLKQDGARIVAARQGDCCGAIEMLLLAAVKLVRDKLPANLTTADDGLLVWKALPAIVMVESARLVSSEEVPDYVALLFRHNKEESGYRGMLQPTEARLTGSILIKKLSESSHSSLIGQVMWWMGENMAPLHKPALNISYMINTSHPISLEEGPMESAGRGLGDPVDPVQYEMFWSFQKSLYDPEVVSNAEKWKACMLQMDCILKACEGPVQVGSDIALQTCGDSTVAFLSSASLLSMQLQDATFRRSVLVEILALVHRAIVADDLLPDTHKKRPKEKMKDDCKQMRPRILAALQATPINGTAFAGQMEAVMDCETAFISWKRDAATKSGKDAPQIQVPQSLSDAITRDLSEASCRQVAARNFALSSEYCAAGRADRTFPHKHSRFDVRLANVTDTARLAAKEPNIEEECARIVNELDEHPRGEKDTKETNGEELAPAGLQRHAVSGQQYGSLQLLRRLGRHDIKTYADVAVARLAESEIIKYAACAHMHAKGRVLPKGAKDWYAAAQAAAKPSPKKQRPRSDKPPNEKRIAQGDEGGDGTDAVGSALNPNAVPFVQKTELDNDKAEGDKKANGHVQDAASNARMDIGEQGTSSQAQRDVEKAGTRVRADAGNESARRGESVDGTARERIARQETRSERRERLERGGDRGSAPRGNDRSGASGRGVHGNGSRGSEERATAQHGHAEVHRGSEERIATPTAHAEAVRSSEERTRTRPEQVLEGGSDRRRVPAESDTQTARRGSPDRIEGKAKRPRIELPARDGAKREGRGEGRPQEDRMASREARFQRKGK